MEYFPRSVDRALDELLAAMGAVVVEGARGCGKTSTGLEHSKSSIRLDSSTHLIELAMLDPNRILRGEAPRLIDEWQLAPSLWNVIRHEIDDRQERGQFILSGSAMPSDDVTRHSGAGRFGRLRMRPMSLAESKCSSGEISLADLASNSSVSAESPLSYGDLAIEAVRGGWPALLGAPPRSGVSFNRSYCEDLCSSDIPSATGVRHDPIRMRRLLESVSRNLAGEATMETLAKDVSADGGSIDTTTVRRYLDSLTKVFALEELPAWSVALRSKSRLRTSSKLHLVDPALACATLGVTSDRLANDPEYFGQVFESMVIRDLRSLASADAGQVFHYRDNTGLEVDAVVEFPDGRWAAIEVKLGSNKISDAERNLLTFRDHRVDLDRVGEPSFLAIVTGTRYAYTLESGVHVVPLGVLGV